MPTEVACLDKISTNEQAKIGKKTGHIIIDRIFIKRYSEDNLSL